LGLYSIASTFAELGQFEKFYGTITIACNGESTLLHWCFKLWASSNPLAKLFDLIQGMQQATIKYHKIIWNWEHVCGHQETHQTVLTILESPKHQKGPCGNDTLAKVPQPQATTNAHLS